MTEEKQNTESMRSNLQSIRETIVSHHFPHTEKHLISWLNWYISISGGTFLFLIGILDNFVIQEKLPFKWAYLVILGLCGISVILFGVSRICLLTRHHNNIYILEVIDKAIKELDNSTPFYKDLPSDMTQKLAQGGFQLTISQSLLRVGMSLFLIAFLLTGVYVIWWVIVYL